VSVLLGAQTERKAIEATNPVLA